MDFGFAIIIDFAMMNTDKLNRLMDVIVEFALLTFRKSYQKVKQHRFWLWDHNGLHHEHWQDQPDQLGGEGDRWWMILVRLSSRFICSFIHSFIYLFIRSFLSLTVSLIIPYQATLAANVKMLKCLCILQIIDVQVPCIAAISPSEALIFPTV